MHPTTYSDLNQVLTTLVRSVQGVLSDELIAAYLQGSFALGDWDAHSDADFLFVTRQEISGTTLHDLQRVHQEVYALQSSWAQHLEGSYITESVLREAVVQTPLWYLDNGSQTLIQSAHCNTFVVRWTTREHGIRLLGPEPRQLIPPVAVADLKREVTEVMRSWATDLAMHPEQIDTRWYQQYAVLSFCRMLHTLVSGEVHSKRVSAMWAIDQFKPRWHNLITTAWNEHVRQRENYRHLADPIEVSRTLTFIEEVLETSSRLPN
jgi:Domain of unknown function (DUF4111)